MAEKLNIQPEAPKDNPEVARSSEHGKSETAEHHAAKRHESAAKHDQQEQLKESRETIERQARSSEDLSKLDRSNNERSNAHTAPPTRELQEMAKDRLLRSVRRRLPAPERALSKFMHAKPVETVSAVGEKTIARPYGLLGGGLSAFVGSALTFYMAKHYGFRYNLFLFFTFFAAGYIIATVLEVIVRSVRRTR